MLADYEQLVKDLVRDDAQKIALAEIDRAIGFAVQRYSKDRERLAVEDITPTDSNTLPLPSGWQADFSELRSLEWPIGQKPPSLIDQSRYSIYQSPGGKVIVTLDAVTVAAASVRSSYTIAHQLDASHDSIPVADREPASCWAAAICCDELAALYSGNTDATIQAANVQNQSKAQEYSTRAKNLRTRYLNELGLNDQRNVAAGAVVELQDKDSRGQARLTHSPAYRNRPW